MADLSPNQQRAFDVVRSFFAAKDRHDLDATMASFVDDASYVFPLSASGTPDPWFVYDGKDAVTDYQRKTLARFSQIRMLDQQFTVGPDADIVFVTSRGDYVQAEDGAHYNNVYVFRFLLIDGRIRRVDEYANPVTFAKLSDLPLG